MALGALPIGIAGLLGSDYGQPAPPNKPIKVTATLQPEHVDHLLGLAGQAPAAPPIAAAPQQTAALPQSSAAASNQPAPLPLTTTHGGFWRSLLHGLNVAGQTAGNIADPAAMTMIPGTEMHREALARAAERKETLDSENAYRNAEAWKDTHPVPPDAWNSLPGTGDLYNRVTGQVTHTGAEPLRQQGKYFTSPDNKITVFVPQGQNPPQGYLPAAPARALNPQTATFEDLVNSGMKPLDAFKELEKAISEGKSSTYSGAYGLVRLAAMYLNYAEQIDTKDLPDALHALRQAAAAEGLKLNIPSSEPPPGTFATAPNGTPLGTHAISAPTTPVRSDADRANRTLPFVLDAMQLVRNPEVIQNLGPISGNWANWAKGAKPTDKLVKRLQADLGAIATAAPTLHSHYKGTEEEFEHLLGLGQSPEDLQTSLGQIYDLFGDIVRQGTRGIPTDIAPAPSAAQSEPIVQRNRRTGAYRYSTDGGKSWHPGQPHGQ